jgi:hypothetical protein
MKYVYKILVRKHPRKKKEHFEDIDVYGPMNTDITETGCGKIWNRFNLLKIRFTGGVL